MHRTEEARREKKAREIICKNTFDQQLASSAPTERDLERGEAEA